MINVIFVCLGNICRSPLAEGIFNALILHRGLSEKIQCFSAGTAGYHIGEPPDSRTLENARNNGIQLNHRGTKFSEKHFEKFDYILVMDDNNYFQVNTLSDKFKDPDFRIFKMRHFDPEGKDKDVPDPYYGDEQGFQDVYEILDRSANNFLNYLIKHHHLSD